MSRPIVIRLTGLVLLFALALLSVPVAPVAAQATLSASPSSTPGTIDFLATGFGDNETLTAWVTGPSQQVQAVDAHSTDGDGNASFSMRMPRHFEAGRWALTVHGLESDEEAVAYFDVTARGPDISLTASPASGPVGTSFTFSGSGFEGEEIVSYWLTGPNGMAYEGGDVVVSDNGSVSFSYTIGAGSQGGMWQMSAYGQSSDRLGVATFTVS
jgi:hypothetical protein